tara:strand:- start:951 stop:1568 length:618 start_codon:yes stop_codon:yes gene_type:complete
MILKNPFWIYHKGLPSKFCDELVEYGNSKRELLGITGEFSGRNLTEKDKNLLKKTRDSNVVWVNDAFIYNNIMPFVYDANKAAGWNFNISSAENAQFTKYKLNQYYTWHQDSSKEPMDAPGELRHNKIRKLSVTCQLSDENDYYGGNLEFQTRLNIDPNKIFSCNKARQKGTIVVFPSHMWHRVTPVTKGTRYSLVVWTFGEQFK